LVLSNALLYFIFYQNASFFLPYPRKIVNSNLKTSRRSLIVE
jgi:hypothetical protein